MDVPFRMAGAKVGVNGNGFEILTENNSPEAVGRREREGGGRKRERDRERERPITSTDGVIQLEKFWGTRLNGDSFHYILQTLQN